MFLMHVFVYYFKQLTSYFAERTFRDPVVIFSSFTCTLLRADEYKLLLPFDTRTSVSSYSMLLHEGKFYMKQN